MGEFTYPDLNENVLALPKNPTSKNKSVLQPSKSHNNIKIIKSTTGASIDPLFKLGDESHRMVLDLAMKQPELLKNVECRGLVKVSDFLVGRKNKRPYCYKLE
jgi:hypothetical protein